MVLRAEPHAPCARLHITTFTTRFAVLNCTGFRGIRHCPQLLGLDYIEAWLAQLLAETRWIAQFDAASCVNVLERACPDYKGLHVNLYDLLLPHENELARTASRARQT